MTSKSPGKLASHTKTDSRFERVVERFTEIALVTRGAGKGFGSGSLKVNGKIFAMMSSRGEFVVKLPKERVDELVASGQAARFDPGHGRLMKEWAVIMPRKTAWEELAQEAYRFVSGSASR